MIRCPRAEALGYGGCPLEPPPDAREILDWLRATAYVRMVVEDGEEANPTTVARFLRGDRQRALAIIDFCAEP